MQTFTRATRDASLKNLGNKNKKKTIGPTEGIGEIFHECLVILTQRYALFIKNTTLFRECVSIRKNARRTRQT